MSNYAEFWGHPLNIEISMLSPGNYLTLIPDLPCCLRRTFSGFISQWMILLRQRVSKHWRSECANFRTSCSENPWNLFFFISSYKLIDKSSKVMQVCDLQISTFQIQSLYILFTQRFFLGFDCVFSTFRSAIFRPTWSQIAILYLQSG